MHLLLRNDIRYGKYIVIAQLVRIEMIMPKILKEVTFTIQFTNKSRASLIYHFSRGDNFHFTLFIIIVSYL